MTEIEAIDILESTPVTPETNPVGFISWHKAIRIAIDVLKEKNRIALGLRKINKMIDSHKENKKCLQLH